MPNDTPAVPEVSQQAHFLTLRIPGIDNPWPGEGGIYAGLTRDSDGKHYHLILGPIATEEMNWDNAVAWAAGLQVDAHHDFTLPTLAEQALLYATLKNNFARDFFWSSEPYAGGPDCAWGRYFSYGDASNNHKSYEYRVAAVRRLFIE